MNIEIVRLFFSLIFFAGLVYGFILSILVFRTNRSYKNPRFWLGVLIFSYSWILFDVGARASQMDEKLIFFKLTYYRIYSMIPISFWLYINNIDKKTIQSFSSFDKLLFSFFFFELIFIAIMFFSNGALLESNFFFSSNFLEYISVILLCIIIFKLHRSKTIFTFSMNSDPQQKWKLRLIGFHLILCILWFISIIHFQFFENNYVVAFLFWVPICVLIFTIGIHFHLFPELLMQPNLSTFQQEQLNVLNKKFYTLSDNDSPPKALVITNTYSVQLNSEFFISQENKKLVEDFLEVLQNSQLYLKQRISPLELKQINHSNVINLIQEELKLTFSDVINYIRVANFMKRIAQGEGNSKTYVSIAEQSGFHSKSLFYSFFKKITGITPSEFVNTLTQNNTKEGFGHPNTN